jgi:hypothetical protein
MSEVNYTEKDAEKQEKKEQKKYLFRLFLIRETT